MRSRPPPSQAARKPAPNASPAPTVSTTRTAGTGTARTPCPVTIRTGPPPSVSSSDGPARRDPGRGLRDRSVRREPGEVVVARPDDVGAGEHPREALRGRRRRRRSPRAGCSGRRRRGRPAVRLRRGPRSSPRPARGRARACRRGGRRYPVAGHPGDPPVDRLAAARSGRLEPVGRGTGRVERRDGEERRRFGRDREGEIHAVRSQRCAQPLRRTRPSTARPRTRRGDPSRASARAVVNGPPPGTSSTAPSGRTSRSIRLSPATTIR